jgi:hypothetical protein
MPQMSSWGALDLSLGSVDVMGLLSIKQPHKALYEPMILSQFLIISPSFLLLFLWAMLLRCRRTHANAVVVVTLAVALVPSPSSCAFAVILVAMLASSSLLCAWPCSLCRCCSPLSLAFAASSPSSSEPPIWTCYYHLPGKFTKVIPTHH